MATIDFGELNKDSKFINSIHTLENNLQKIEDSLNLAIEFSENHYDELSLPEKVKLDNYMAYALNSLYWMHAKLHGEDMNDHAIINELSRVRQTILRDKHIQERNTIRPVLNKAAAGRFIHHGLHIKRGTTDDQNEDEQSKIDA